MSKLSLSARVYHERKAGRGNECWECYSVLETNKNNFWFKPKQTETRSVSHLFRFVSWNQKQKISVCFEPISKQQKQTDLFRNNPKQTETTLNFLKNTQIYSLLNCWVGLLFVSVQSKHRNSLFRYRSETTETNCFETNRKKPEKP